jgi:hypothetical protein
MLKKLLQAAVKAATDYMRCEGCEHLAVELKDMTAVAEEQRSQALNWAKSASDRASQLEALKDNARLLAAQAERYKKKWEVCLKTLGDTERSRDEWRERAESHRICSRCDGPAPPATPVCSECGGKE